MRVLNLHVSRIALRFWLLCGLGCFFLHNVVIAQEPELQGLDLAQSYTPLQHRVIYVGSMTDVSSFDWKSGSVYAQELMYQGNLVESWTLSGRNVAVMAPTSAKMIQPGLRVQAGNEVGDPLFQELTDAGKKENNRTPMMRGWWKTSAWKGARAWGSFDQVDHYAGGAGARSRRVQNSGQKPFAWFGENYPHYSRLHGGVEWQNETGFKELGSREHGILELGIHGGQDYLWIGSEPLLRKSIGASSSWSSLNIFLQRDQLDYWDESGQEVSDFSLYYGQFSAGQVECLGNGFQAGLDFLYLEEPSDESKDAQQNQSGGFLWKWDESNVAFPWLRHRIEVPGLQKLQAQWTGFHGRGSTDWLAYDSLQMYLPLVHNLVWSGEVAQRSGNVFQPLGAELQRSNAGIYHLIMPDGWWHENHWLQELRWTLHADDVGYELKFWNGLTNSYGLMDQSKRWPGWARRQSVGLDAETLIPLTEYSALNAGAKMVFSRLDAPVEFNPVRKLPEREIQLWQQWSLGTGMEILARWRYFDFSRRGQLDGEIRQKLRNNRLVLYATFMNVFDEDRPADSLQSGPDRFRIVTGLDWFW